MQQTQKQKMLAGQLYHAGDPEIQSDQQSATPGAQLHKFSVMPFTP